jgi:hypothetical protein
MEVELRPKDSFKGKLVSFEAEMRDDSTSPRLVVFNGAPKDLFKVICPQMGSQRRADDAYTRVGQVTNGSWACEPHLMCPLTRPLQRPT